MAKMLARALCVLVLAGCSTVRTEFFRGETRHLYARGCEAYAAGDFAGAHEALARLVALDPRHARAHAGLGHLALVREDGEAAERCYRLALACEPGLTPDLIPWIVQARALRQHQRLAGSGIDLHGLLVLMEAGEEEDIREALEACGDLETLARDAFSLSPAERLRLKRRVMTRLMSAGRSPAEGLFAGVFLAAEGGADALAARTLEIWLAANPGDVRRPCAWRHLLPLYGRNADVAAFEGAAERAAADGLTDADLVRIRREAAHVARRGPSAPSPGPSPAVVPEGRAQAAWFRLTTME